MSLYAIESVHDKYSNTSTTFQRVLKPLITFLHKCFTTSTSFQWAEMALKFVHSQMLYHANYFSLSLFCHWISPRQILHHANYIPVSFILALKIVPFQMLYNADYIPVSFFAFENRAFTNSLPGQQHWCEFLSLLINLLQILYHAIFISVSCLAIELILHKRFTTPTTF